MNNLTKHLLIAGIIMTTSQLGNTQEATEFSGKTITLQSSDNLKIKADFYEAEKENAPVILLFHQARYSRGEYRPTAGKLNKLGFSCLAIDQRSGDQINGVVNETFQQAKKLGLGTHYPDAAPDLITTIEYAKNNFKDRKIILWGSSYSASLVLILGERYQSIISGIVAFSPGEYFTYENKKVKDFAAKLECPVFITSAGNEHKAWKAIYEAIPSEEKHSFLPEFKGKHGSQALWKENEGHEAYWKELEKFLNKVK